MFLKWKFKSLSVCTCKKVNSLLERLVVQYDVQMNYLMNQQQKNKIKYKKMCLFMYTDNNRQGVQKKTKLLPKMIFILA